MTRSKLSVMPDYFDRYINQCDDVSCIEAIQISIKELENAPIEKWKLLGNKVFAPGKWTIKDILQHLIDTERIFGYRALAFARNEKKKMLSFDENSYAKTANANARTIENLVAELMISHQSLLALYLSFSPEIIAKSGKGATGTYSVEAIGFILPGHQRWHFGILEERYFPLLNVH
jgi:hypothetical protein